MKKQKKDGDIADLWRRVAAKKNSSSSPEAVAHDSVPSTNVSRISDIVPSVRLTNASRASGDNVILEEEEGQANEGSSSPPVAPVLPPPPPPPVYDPDRLPQDPGERKPIESYPVNDQDAIRRAYILKGPAQQCAQEYEKRHIGTRDRSFNPLWFYKYHWLEYSIKKDAAFCFVCYLFKKRGHKSAFVDPGWRNWNREDALNKHVGKVDSAHNAALERYLSYLTPSAQIDDAIVQLDSEERRLYKIRLTYSIRCLRFLLNQGLAFRGHDESDDLVYLLLKLVLILPVATASVERSFSAMNFIKNRLRNRMRDALLDDCLVTFIEREIFLNVLEDDIIDTFMSIRRRRPDRQQQPEVAVS